MSTDQKIIKNKVGVLKLAEMLGCVSLRVRSLLFHSASSESATNQLPSVPTSVRHLRHQQLL